MKLTHLIEAEKVTVVRPWAYHVGKRGASFSKLYLMPFQRVVDAELKSLKAKWNGRDGYEFDVDKAEAGKAVLNKYAALWNQLLKDHPEDEQNFDALIANSYFDHLKKNKLA